ncbi:MAG: hypothetical protein IAE84_06775 [Saprospiraceae bacterium]|nr:hypothetical protein [Saprospiraceae bacterium]
MKYTPLPLLFMLFLATATAQPAPGCGPEWDSIFNYAQGHSVLRDSVNWAALRPTLDSVCASEGLIPATKRLLHELRDFHGKIWVDNMPHHGPAKPWSPTSMRLDTTLMGKLFRNEFPVFAQRLPGRIGYIRVPGITFGERDSINARIIRQAMEGVQKGVKLRGWIVDLRLNGGGTMFPMLAGLGALLGDSTEIGSFIHPDAGYKEAWTLRQGEVFVGEYQVTDYGLWQKMGIPRSLSSLPVAVMISAATASSGEVTALAFRNRPRTRFFGEDTAGYTTAVSWQPISDQVVLQLTESYYADRLENVFPGTPVLPDERCDGGENFYQITKDQMIQRALEWLKKQ